MPLPLSLPSKPGVYLFKNKTAEILYIGKAANLKSRVKSYFAKEAVLFPKIAAMVSQVARVDHFVVDSEFEALLLEANLIKKYQPKYNTRLKDDKSYLYIKITTDEDFPHVLTARREKLSGVTYFGPFPSARTVRTTLRSLRRIFPYCQCNFKVCQKKESCLWVELGLDSGPCLNLVDKRTYRQMIKRLILLLSGKKEKLLKTLEKEMRQEANQEDFEMAQKIKKQIAGIAYLTRPYISPHEYLEHPDILQQKRKEKLLGLRRILNLAKIPQRIEGYDISDIKGRQATGSMVVLTSGELDKSEYRHFRIRIEGQPNDVAMLAEVIRRRLNHPEWSLPDLIVVDGGKGQVGGMVRVLEEAKISIPVIGLAKRLEEIIVPKQGRPALPAGRPVLLPHDSPVLHLLQRLRDESHRFALTYHRKLRIKRLLSAD